MRAIAKELGLGLPTKTSRKQMIKSIKQKMYKSSSGAGAGAGAAVAGEGAGAVGAPAADTEVVNYLDKLFVLYMRGMTTFDDHHHTNLQKDTSRYCRTVGIFINKEEAEKWLHKNGKKFENIFRLEIGGNCAFSLLEPNKIPEWVISEDIDLYSIDFSVPTYVMSIESRTMVSNENFIFNSRYGEESEMTNTYYLHDGIKELVK